MPTTFNVIFLGIAANDLDPTEGNTTSENLAALVGSTFGGPGSPLYDNVRTWSPVGDPGPTYEINNNPDQFSVGGITYRFDSGGAYDATVTFADGTTATVVARIAQSTTGELFLVPATAGQEASQAPLEAKPILSVTFTAAQPSTPGMSADRLTGNFIEPVDGSGGNDSMGVGYTDADGDAVTDGADVIRAGDGNDTINAGSGDDVIFGGAGNDRIDDWNGNDLVYAGAGNDTADVSVGNDTIHMDGGDDLVNMRDNAGTKTLYGGDGIDTLDFRNWQSATGASVTYNPDGSGSFSHFNGATTGTFEGFEVVSGTANADTMNASAATSGVNIWGEEGNDSLTGGAGNDTLRGDAGNDTIAGGNGNDSLAGSAGNDSLFGGAGNDGLFGGDDSDSLDGGDGNDTLNGGAGNDTLTGGAGNDDLTGGTGNDQMSGGDGTDIFFVGLNDGADTITGGEGGVDYDTLMFTGGTSGVAVTFTGTEAGTYTYGTGTGTFSQIEAVTATLQADTIDGTALTTGMVVTSSAGNDSITMGSGADTIDAGSGDDTVSGGGGNDNILGGTGNDSLLGGDGNDTLSGGDGNDTLDGGAGNDSIRGDFGSDLVQVAANQGSDTLDGGVGTDMLRFTTGGNTSSVTVTFNGIVAGTYAFTGGGTGSFSAFELFEGTTNTDTVDLTFAPSNTPLSVIYLDPTTALISDGMTTVAATSFEHYLMGAGADTVNATGTASTLFIDGGAGNDNLTGGSGSDTIQGGAGDDSIVGGAGNDSLSGGDGNDALYGGSGDDTLDGGTGNDTITGGEGDDLLSGGDGADTFVVQDGFGNDTIVGGAGQDAIDGAGLTGDTSVTFTGDGAGFLVVGNDSADFSAIEEVRTGSGRDTIDASATTSGVVISSGAGSDDVLGGAGDDTILGGAGRDQIIGGAGNDVLFGGADADRFVILDGAGDDTVFGGEDGNDADLLDLSGVGQGVVVTFTGSEAGTVFNASGNSVTFSEIEELFLSQHDDVLDAGASSAAVLVSGEGGADTLAGGTGDDVLYGGDGDDSVAGNAGDDTLEGGDGRDTLTGGAGNDSLTGGAGDDLFRFANGFGNDTIGDFDLGDDDADGRTNDQLDLSGYTVDDGSGPRPLTWSDITLSQDPNGNALLTFPGGETITLQGRPPSDFDTQPEGFAAGLPCFVQGTPILTPDGERPVEDIRAGDLVVTQDRGTLPVIWAGHRALCARDLDTRPDWRPIHFAPGAVGNRCALRLSPQHGVAVQLAGGRRVLVRARHLAEAGLPGVRVARGVRAVIYHHLLLPRHAILSAAGAPAESFYPGPEALRMLGWEQAVAVIAALRIWLPDHVATPTRPTPGVLVQHYGARALPVAVRARRHSLRPRNPCTSPPQAA